MNSAMTALLRLLHKALPHFIRHLTSSGTPKSSSESPSVLTRRQRGAMKNLPGLVLFAALGSAAFYGYETEVARPASSYLGVPVTQNDWQNLTHTLRNQGYMVGYSERLRNPLWVVYRVESKRFSPGKRPAFEVDWRSPAQVSPRDYIRTGYDRGHLAPNYVIASRYGIAAQKETFLMTNISPQKPKFNQKIWQRLEEISADVFSQQFPTFWVFTGPIFEPTPKTLRNTSIAIPKAFYKIFIVPSPQDHPTLPPVTLSFIIPQTAPARANLLDYVTTIDAIEAETGIDFFAELDDALETRMESTKNPDAWSLKRVAQRPPRY